MGTFTAQLLVGNSHPYDGGINTITHTLYLSENSRPVWILLTNDGKRIMRWIPTLENMLDDGLLMIGLYVLKDEELLKMKNQYFVNERPDYIELYSDVKPEHLVKMYSHCRQLKDSRKIMLSVFAGSSIEGRLPVLKNYQLDMEVCLSIYKKEHSVWSGRQEEIGELK